METRGRSAEVDDFLAGQPDEYRAALEALRDQIHRAAPGSSERIAYGIPIVTHAGRNLVGFNAAKGHCTLQLMSTAALDRHADELRDRRTGGGSIQFAPEDPLPEELVRRLVRARIAENEELAARQSKGR